MTGATKQARNYRTEPLPPGTHSFFLSNRFPPLKPETGGTRSPAGRQGVGEALLTAFLALFVALFVTLVCHEFGEGTCSGSVGFGARYGSDC